MRTNDWLLRIRSGPTGFCAGCPLGTITNYTAQALDQLKQDVRTLLSVGGIGCSAWIPDKYMMSDTGHTTHGRAIPFAVGAKLARPELTALVISGDGDIATIGTNHLVHACKRNHDINVICVNNMVYGMTGGQVSGTTPIHSITTTSPQGNTENAMDLIALTLGSGCKMAARYPAFPAVVRSEQVMINAIKRAIRHPGFSFLEFVAPCPTHYNRKNNLETPAKVRAYLEDNYIKAPRKKTAKLFDRQGKQLFGQWTGITEYAKLLGED